MLNCLEAINGKASESDTLDIRRGADGPRRSSKRKHDVYPDCAGLTPSSAGMSGQLLPHGLHVIRFITGKLLIKP
jgi:hypothetical protein